jgi:hypothetical protein
MSKLQTKAILNKQTQKLRYTDDIDIIGRSQAAVRVAFLALVRERLKINKNKKKYVIAAGNDRTIRDVGENVAFGDTSFEVAKE